MEKLDRQVRVSSMLEMIEYDKRRGTLSFDQDVRNGIYSDVLESLLSKSPLEEEDLVVRAMMTQNLLKYYETSMRYVIDIDAEDWRTIQRYAIEGVMDPTFDTCDNSLAKEIQNNNIVFSSALHQRNHDLFSREQVTELMNKAEEICRETYNEGLLKSDEKRM